MVDVRRRTALVGRNESGKSNLLMALRSLKPAEGVKALSKIKDFPKDRRMSEYSDELPVVDTRWSLSQEEQVDLITYEFEIEPNGQLVILKRIEDTSTQN